MDSRVVVSAPFFTKPLHQQTPCPPIAYSDTPLPPLPPLDFTIRQDKLLEDPGSEHLYQTILRNLYKLYLLLVLVSADLTLLLCEYPFHTLFFMCKSSTRSVLGLLFQFYHGKSEASKYPQSGNIIEVLAWWYSAWRWEVEKLGKGNGYVSWQTSQQHISYWPFESREKAFEFLDVHLRDPEFRSCPITRHLSLKLLGEYLEHCKARSLQKRPKPSPLLLPASSLRRQFKTCHGPDAAELLVEYSDEYVGATFRFGFTIVDGVRTSYHIRVGEGDFGTRVCHRISFNDVIITGVAIGTLVDTGLVVVVEPNGSVYLVWDPDSEMPLPEEVGYTICSVFPTIAGIGGEFVFKDFTESYDYQIVRWSEYDSPPP